MKKILVSLLCAVMIVTFMPSMAFAGDNADDTANVSNREELKEALDNDTIKVINILNNIDMGSEAWTGVKLEAGRELIINGNGNTISNLKVYKAYMGPNGSGVPGDGGSSDYYTGWIADNQGNLTVNDLFFTNAEIDANPVTAEKESTGSSILAVVCANNGGTVELNNVNVDGSIVKGYSKVGILHGFTQGNGKFTANHCAVTNSTVVVEADGTDPEACFSGVLIGYDGNRLAKTNGIKMSGNKSIIAESVKWDEEPVYHEETGVTSAKTSSGVEYGITCETYTKDGLGVNAVKFAAAVDGYQFETLEDAIAAAQVGETVTLLKDVNTGENGIIIDAQSVNLDLNDKTLTGPVILKASAHVSLKGPGTITGNKSSAAFSSFVVEAGAEAELDNVIIENTMEDGNLATTAYAMMVYGNASIRNSNIISTRGGAGVLGAAQLLLENTNITAQANCITSAAENSDSRMSVIIRGGTFKSEGTSFNDDKWNYSTIYWPSHGTLNIENGDFSSYDDEKGSAAILQKNGTVKIENGTFHAKDAFKIVVQADTREIETVVEDGNFSGTRSGIYVDGSAANANGLQKYQIDVRGGKYTGGPEKHAIYTKNGSLDKDKIRYFSGGTFDEPILEEHLKKGTENYKRADGTYSVAEETQPGEEPLIEPTPGYHWEQNEKGEFVEVKDEVPPYIPPTNPVQKPVIEAEEGATVTLSKDGTTATIVVDENATLKDVILNGQSLGPVTEVKNLKTGDKLVIVVETEAEKNERLIKGVQNTTIRMYYKSGEIGKGWIKVRYKKSYGYKVDNYEIFRSAKKKTNFGKKAWFVTKTNKTTGYYKNGKSVKKGTRYYYKMRGVREIAGETVYTQWSNIVMRTGR